MKVSYFSSCNKISTIPKEGVAIIDEVETFQDKEYLEINNNILIFVVNCNIFFKSFESFKSCGSGGSCKFFDFS